MSPLVAPSQQIDQAFLYIIGISIAILIGITVTMVVFVIKYRRSKHPIPANIRGNSFLEITWTVIPTLIALSMFYIGWSSYTGLRNVPEGALEISVTGQMFSWIITYPNDKETENTIVVPLGKPVKLNITATDVLHSFFVPAFRIKVDAVPGMTTYTWFYPDKLGDFLFMCTEYCGTGHSDMNGIVRVVSAEDYEKWLEDEDEDEEEEEDEEE